MPTPSIDLQDNVKLPFMKSPYRDLSDEELENVDHQAALERMRAAMPAEAIELGCLEYHLDHSPGLSWKIEDHFFLVSLSPKPGKWALIRIYWDDNWGSYKWSSDATGHGFTNADKAAKAMVKALFDSWTESEQAPEEDETQEDSAAEARRAFLKNL